MAIVYLIFQVYTAIEGIISLMNLSPETGLSAHFLLHQKDLMQFLALKKENNIS